MFGINEKRETEYEKILSKKGDNTRMSYFENLNISYQNIKKRLMDEESVKLFDARVEYTFTRNLEKLNNEFFDKTKQWRCIELENFCRDLPERKIVLFGAGKVGRKTKEYLNVCGYFPICFCDNYIKEDEVDGIQVLSIDELVRDYKDAIVIICSLIYRKEIYSQLLERDYPRENILLPGGNRIHIQYGRQYFDFFQPKSEEVFVDAGAFDGSTAAEFFSWARGGKCYSLEPVPEMYNRIIERVNKEKWENIIVCNCAAWDKEESVFLTKDQKENGVIWGGSRIGELGQVVVKGRPIDQICAGDRVTFIKMDVEGSELRALQGAKNIIVQHKPRLAISVYHKPEDIFEIPDYILSLVPEYKLYIRQYEADANETVLYAEV